MQPHLVEIAAHLYRDDPSEQLVGSLDTLVTPWRWEIPAAATAIHGITNMDAHTHGQPLENVLGTFWHLAYMADEIVVQNWDFELTILRSAFARIGHSGKVALFLERVVRDTTVMGRILFPELPLSGHGRGPSLSRMWQHVFGVPRAKGTHRARRDDQDLRTLFLALEAIQCGRATVEDFRNAARIGDPGAGTPDADREGSASGEAPASTASTSQP